MAAFTEYWERLQPLISNYTRVSAGFIKKDFFKNDHTVVGINLSAPSVVRKNKTLLTVKKIIEIEDLPLKVVDKYSSSPHFQILIKE